MQRWSPRGRPWPRERPRGHILKSLTLASRPQVFENCPFLGSRTALFFELLKFCWTPEKKFLKAFFTGERLKIFRKTFFFFFFFFWRILALVSLFLALASCIPVLGLERVCSRKGCPWPRIFLCPWPWPRALCPRLHLWFCDSATNTIRTTERTFVLMFIGRFGI